MGEEKVNRFKKGMPINSRSEMNVVPMSHQLTFSSFAKLQNWFGGIVYWSHCPKCNIDIQHITYNRNNIQLSAPVSQCTICCNEEKTKCEELVCVTPALKIKRAHLSLEEMDRVLLCTCRPQSLTTF